jgi:hypothetical protein
MGALDQAVAHDDAAGLMSVPDWKSAPKRLREMDGHCGVLAAWGVLTHFGLRVSAGTIAQRCRFTKIHGVFTISLALALRERALQVTYHSEPDAAPHRIEQGCYVRTQREG